MKKRLMINKHVLYMIMMFFTSSFLYAISVTIFINQSNNMILPAGVSGVAMLISRIVNQANPTYEVGFYYLFIYVTFNLPLFVLAYKSIGKIFSLITLANVILTSSIIAILSQFFAANPTFLDRFIDGSTMDPVTIALIAGALTGSSVGLALVANFSTGGTDILSLFFGIKKGVSIGKYVLLLNIVVVLASGIYSFVLGSNLNAIFYTAIYIGVSSTIVDFIFTRTKKVLLEIISNKGDEIANYILTETNHGCTIMDAVGAYSSTEKKVLHIVVSVRQIKQVIHDVKIIDPNSFTIQLPVDMIHGKFYIPPFK